VRRLDGACAPPEATSRRIVVVNVLLFVVGALVVALRLLWLPLLLIVGARVALWLKKELWR